LLPQVNRLAASVEESKAEAALSAAQYKRALGVQAAGALSAEEIEHRRATSLTDDAKVKVAAAQLAEFQARLERTDVRAPADGLVLTRSAEEGQIASPGGTPLFRLARNGEIEMRGQIAEQDMARLRVGQPAAVYITNVAKPFEGRVRLLGAVIDPMTRLGEIRIALGSDPVLRPGAFARGEVTIDHDVHPVLPQTAVLADSKGSYVFIVNAKNEVERRTVSVIDTTAAGVVIGAGLTGSERIVTTAAGFLREGERVSAVLQREAAS
jgi:RND family efflux transporter MFP subunit